MRPFLHTIGYLLLAMSLVTAGMPVHAWMANSGIEAQFSQDAGPASDQSPDADQGECPGHKGQPVPLESVDSETTCQDCSESGECSVSDCRCACPGLTLVMPVSVPASVMTPAPDAPVRVNQLLTSVTTEGLLRPPQS